MADHDQELDHLFAAARQHRPALPEVLAVRIETDAEAVRLQRLAPVPRAARPIWRRAFDGIGGWRGFGGLAAASAAGVWIGFSAPAFLPDPANYLLSQETVYLVADLSLDVVILEETE
ncbi:hypothetical protein [Ruegeria sp.]|uniref:hypothetical protein n=1 Tax=Ruegeria sp. TaxID=1879320 RepID=UPI002308C084|nr:hypothetical protein [Ruegeria sp.]MDA7963047.1 hypothetical protein [Ruegeria sp.]